MGDREDDLKALIASTKNGGFGDPGALDQRLREMDHANFKFTQRNNLRIATPSAFVGATLGGAFNAFVSPILLQSSECAAKTVLPQCERDRRALVVALSPLQLVQAIVSHTRLILGQIRVAGSVAGSPAKAKVQPGQLREAVDFSCRQESRYL